MSDPIKEFAIETDRLLLRRWRESDSEPFHATNSDPAVVEFLPKPLSRDESDAVMDRYEKHFEDHGYGRWAVALRSTGELIGFVGFAIPTFTTKFTPCVKIGWRLARQSWRNGYATEAASAALKHGFESLGFDEIVSFTVPLNLRSIAVMERLKMTRNPNEDFNHPMLEVDDRLSLHVQYRLVRKDWDSES